MEAIYRYSIRYQTLYSNDVYAPVLYLQCPTMYRMTNPNINFNINTTQPLSHPPLLLISFYQPKPVVGEGTAELALIPDWSRTPVPEHLVNGLGPLAHEALSELLCFLQRRVSATPHLRLLSLSLRTGRYQSSTPPQVSNSTPSIKLGE